jgi:glycosyltransferase involved in cell wall biosynthesis
MNVLLVNIWLDVERGAGTAQRTRGLARVLADLGCKCSILAMGRTPWGAELAAAGVDVHLAAHLGRRHPIPIFDPLELWRLIRAADIVHVTGYWYALAAIVYFLAFLARAPFVLCPAGELLAFDDSPWWKRLYHKLLGKRMLASASLLIAVTAQERDDLIRRFGTEPTRIIVVPNGIRFPGTIKGDEGVLENNALGTSAFVLFVGRLARVKGPDLLIEAFAKINNALPDVELVMIGPDFGMLPELQARVHELGLAKRIRFLGFVDELKLNFFYRHAALLVVPSRSEVMSMVALEAGAAGTPVLLTESCGFDEVAEHGGGIVTTADADAIAQALMSMLANRTELKHMGQRMQRLVLHSYTWPPIAQSLLNELAMRPKCQKSG